MAHQLGSTFNPAAGLLRADQFQVAYATNDIEHARSLFQLRYGISSFRGLDGELAQGGKIHIELAWVGNTMYELLTAVGPGSDFFMRQLPASDFAIRHHHLGFWIDNQEQWDALMTEIERGVWAMPLLNSIPGFGKSCFVEAPELNHYLEYLFPSPSLRAFYESLPRS